MATEDPFRAALRSAHDRWSPGAGARFPSDFALVRTPDAIAADAWAAWQERAAIREHLGGLERDEAEILTVLEQGAEPPAPAAW